MNVASAALLRSTWLLPRTALRSFSTSSTSRAVEPVTSASAKVTSSIDALARMRTQPRAFAVVEIHGRPFTVTNNDVIVMDRMKRLNVGDIIQLDKVRELGTQDYTLRGKPFLNPSYSDIQAVVIEHAEGPVRTVTKMKRRKGYRRTYHTIRYKTLLRVTKCEIAAPSS